MLWFALKVNKGESTRGHTDVRDGFHAKARAVLRNYKKDGAPFWNDLLVAHVTGADDGAGFDVAILREADHEADVDAGSASLWFAMKRRLAPFTGEMCEGGLVGW